jgi:tetratricopeptide (TPR) repeat protein
VPQGAARRETSFLLGVVYQKSDRAEQAQRAFASVLADDDEHWRARFHLALLHVSQEAWGEAEAQLQRVLEQNPGHATAAALLGKLTERRAAEQNRLEPPDADVTEETSYIPLDEPARMPNVNPDDPPMITVRIIKEKD